MSDTKLQSCRFYRNKLPKMDDIVMATVTSIISDGYYVHLSEYGNIEGFVTISEASRVRFSSLKKLVNVGSNLPLLVLTIDDSNYIDLSRRRLSDEEIKKFEQKYFSAKILNNIFSEVFARQKEIADAKVKQILSKSVWECVDKTSFQHFYSQQVSPDIEQFMEKYLWSVIDKYDSFEDFYAKLLVNPAIITNEDAREEILKRRKQTPAKLECLIELSCFMEDGVEAIKKALLSYKDIDIDERVNVHVSMVSPPIYRLLASCLDKELASKELSRVAESIKNKMTEQKGNFSVKKEIFTLNEKVITLN